MIGHDKSYHNPLQSVFDLPEADLTMQTIRKSTNLLHHADHFGLFGILKIISLSLIFAFFFKQRGGLKGSYHKKKFFRPSLIFWIVMGCGKARFGRKGQKTPKIENFGPKVCSLGP